MIPLKYTFITKPQGNISLKLFREGKFLYSALLRKREIGLMFVQSDFYSLEWSVWYNNA